MTTPYQLKTNGMILRTEDGAQIPPDPANVDYQAFQVWAAVAGNTPDPAPLEPTDLAAVSPRQIRMALTQTGLRAAVEAAVAAGSQDLKDWWGYSTQFERSNPQVAAMATALSVPDAQIDALWLLAATL